MKKKYVKLELQVVDIELNNCIASSGTQFIISEGQSTIFDVNGTGTLPGDDGFTITPW